MLGGQLLLAGSWRLLFVVLALASAGGPGPGVCGPPRDPAPHSGCRPRHPARGGGALLRLQLDPRFMGTSLVMTQSFAMTFTTFPRSPSSPKANSAPPRSSFSLIFGVNSLGMVLGNQVNTMLIDQNESGPRRLLAGLLGALASVAVLVGLTIPSRRTWSS